MKRLLMILASLLAVSAFGESVTNVTVRLSPDVYIIGTHTNVIFRCTMTVNNQTEATFTATNLFSMPPGLALLVIDSHGKPLKRLYAPWKTPDWIIHPGTNQINWLYYGMGDGLTRWRENQNGVSLPDAAKTVRLQIEGNLSGSSYTNRLTSNIVEVEVP